MKKPTQIEIILNNKYGVGVVYAPKEAVLWAASEIQTNDEAKKQLKEINRIRTKHGMPLVYAPYGHKAF